MPKKHKKYKKCRECRYHSIFCYCNHGYLCKATETTLDRMRLCEDLNKNGDCELYKTAWLHKIFNW